MIDKFFKDRHGKFVFAQMPNRSLIFALIFWIIAELVKNTGYYNMLKSGFFVMLAYWAYLEITDGVTYFRKTLGFVVAIYVIISMYKLWT